MSTKRNFVFSIILIAATVINNPAAAQDGRNSTNPTGEYLGQKPPGTTPVLFAPGLISVPDMFEHSAAVFSPDKKEVYWSAKFNGHRNFQIYFIKKTNGKWTERQTASFCLNYNLNYPVFSPDGNKLYFTSDRPVVPGGERKDTDIWVVDRKDGGWSEPYLVPSVINSSEYEILHTITRDGSFYFTKMIGSRKNIYVSRYINRNLTAPVNPGKNFNSGNLNITSLYAAPDESYIIMEAILDKRTAELFISYKLKNNSWSDQISLSLGWGRFPSVSPDGKYLFYMTRDGIYWVNTSFIEDLKPDETKKMEGSNENY